MHAMINKVACVSVGLFAMAWMAGITLAIDIPVNYTVDDKVLKDAVSGTTFVFELFSDATCTMSVALDGPVAVDDLLIERLKRFKPKGASDIPKTARIHHVLPSSTLPTTAFLKVTGTGIVPVGGDCQPQLIASAGGGGDPATQSELDAETAARIAADTTLQGNINAEAAARAAADSTLQSNIDAEAAARAAADTTLQSNINAEAAARAAADSFLQGNIDAEAAARAAADTTLQSNINAEAAARVAADSTLQGNINAHQTNGLHSSVTAQTGDVRVLTAGAGVILESTLGNCFRVTVSSTGTLLTSAVACP